MVVDACVSAAWFIEERDSRRARAVLASGPTTIEVPAVWPIETANVFAVRERRGRGSAAVGDGWWRALLEMPVVVDPLGATWEGARRCWTLAREFDLSVYDAQYLELALRRQLPLATLDRRLEKAAERAGVNLAIPRVA